MSGFLRARAVGQGHGIALGARRLLVLVLGAYVGAAVLERMLRDLGASAAEASERLPGDDVVAGWYAIDHIDNNGRSSAREIHPEWQSPSAGDLLDAIPGCRIAFPVLLVEQERALVIGGPVARETRQAVAAARAPFSWAFVLREDPGERTRLLVRARRAVAGPWYEAPARLIWTFGHVPMQQVQLRRLRTRAISAGASSPR